MALDHSDANDRVDENKRVEGLAHALSHDVRAVFRSTQGFAQVVSERAGERLTDEDRALLNRIVDASQRGNALLENIVGWLRTTTHTPRPRPVDLRFLLEWAASECPSGELTLHTEGQAEAVGDEYLLKRLFDVLLANACRFRADPSSPAEVHVAFVPVSGGVQVCMHDAGVGFDPLLADRLFEPFFALAAPGQVAGQGLGLAIAAAIVAKHSGNISISSPEAHGTDVVFFLPEPPASE